MNYYQTTKKVVNGIELFRIRALTSFGYVKAGDIGGYVQSEKNLSHIGNAWVSDDANIYGNASVSGDAWVSGDADYITVKGFGMQYRTTTFFRCKDNKVCVNCGCFYGTLYEFRNQVKNTCSGKIAKEYLMIADLVEYHFK